MCIYDVDEVDGNNEHSTNLLSTKLSLRSNVPPPLRPALGFCTDHLATQSQKAGTQGGANCLCSLRKPAEYGVGSNFWSRTMPEQPP
eukprot:16354547-Heterocapsa_arctica.AAC.1